MAAKKKKAQEEKPNPVTFTGDLPIMDRAAWTQYLWKLQGRTIETVLVEPNPEGWGEPYIALVLDDGTQVVALRDAEGNGPGHLDVHYPEDQKGN